MLSINTRVLLISVSIYSAGARCSSVQDVLVFSEFHETEVGLFNITIK